MAGLAARGGETEDRAGPLSLFRLILNPKPLPPPIPCSLEAALASPTITPETVTALLNLAEFMEHDDKRLPLDTRTLGALAEKCHAFAKVRIVEGEGGGAVWEAFGA